MTAWPARAGLAARYPAPVGCQLRPQKMMRMALKHVAASSLRVCSNSNLENLNPFLCAQRPTSGMSEEHAQPHIYAMPPMTKESQMLP
mmetsp:Transcript_71238/g.170604  ORF Transcript_71238/g.170604 Transcript_71238/m.170604 type:complete len:88 (+) Transcript_71238:3613-3876(+)